MSNTNNSFSCNFLTLNVKGIRDRNKREKIFNWCRSKAADIIFLQETFSTPDVEKKWESLWDGTCIFSHGTNHSKGVLILIDSKLDIEIISTNIDLNGRYVIINCIIQGQKIVLGNVYFPTRQNETDQVQFLNILSDKLYKDNAGEFSFILGGDFNVIRDKNLDYMGQSSLKKQSKFSIELEDFMNRFRMIDIWRSKHKDKKQYTYKQGNPFMQSRLDYWLI